MKQELYHWLYQMDLFRECFRDDDALKSAMLNTVKFYEMVHDSGLHLVGPINLHELLIDPENGHFEVKAGEDRDSLMQDIDSVKFMPPEILNTDSRWSIDADKFVLAELLFVIRYCKHPYDGKLVLNQPITDVNKAKQLYGEGRFIFDLENSENGLDYYADPGPIDAWTHDDNSQLKEAFIQVFTKGVSDTSLRISDKGWKEFL